VETREKCVTLLQKLEKSVLPYCGNSREVYYPTVETREKCVTLLQKLEQSVLPYCGNSREVCYPTAETREMCVTILQKLERIVLPYCRNSKEVCYPTAETIENGVTPLMNPCRWSNSVTSLFSPNRSSQYDVYPSMSTEVETVYFILLINYDNIRKKVSL